MSKWKFIPSEIPTPERTLHDCKSNNKMSSKRNTSGEIPRKLLMQFGSARHKLFHVDFAHLTSFAHVFVVVVLLVESNKNVRERFLASEPLLKCFWV